MTDETHPPALDAAQAELLTRATRAARELCELLWESLHQELRNPREERIRELSRRLGEVSSTVALLTRPAGGGTGPAERRCSAEPVTGSRPVAPVPSPPPISPLPTGEPGRPHPAAASESASAPSASPSLPPPPAQPPSSPAPVRMRLVDELETQADAPPVQASAIGEVRPQEGPSAWVNALGGLLQRHAVDGLPFAVLLVEVVDVAHIERSESQVQVNNLIAQVEGALSRALRSYDVLTKESFGRYWLVAPETNGTGARMLAERLARLVKSSASHRGVPLEVAIGIAVCPEDGIEAPELAARADLSVYSARATGQPVARTEPPGV